MVPCRASRLGSRPSLRARRPPSCRRPTRPSSTRSSSDAGRLRLTALFDRARTLVADEPLLLAGEALRAADPALRSLANLNTPEDYAAALAEAGLSSTIPS